MSQILRLNRVVHFSVKDLKATRSLIDHLVTSPNDSIILPYIDYPGPLSHEILARDLRSLTVCEPVPEIREQFSTFVAKHHPAKNVRIHPDDLFDLSFKTYSDTAQGRCAEIARDNLELGNPSVSLKHDDEKKAKFLVPLLKSKHEAGFLRNMYYQVSLRIGLCAGALVHYYFLMSDRQKAYIEAKAGENMRLYRSSSVLYNTLFKMKTLESYDLESCFGISLRKIQKTASANNASYTRVHLVSIEPRLDVLGSVSPRSLIEYRFLVTQMMQKRKRLVVTFLDKFFDNYREDLAAMGIDESTIIGELSHEQYYQLFLYLNERPDYKNSTFLHAVLRGDDNFMSSDQ